MSMATALRDLDGTIEDLMQEVELQMALRAIEAPKMGWEILRDARRYLAGSLTDDNSGCVPDFDDRVTAYFEIAKLEESLMPHCEYLIAEHDGGTGAGRFVKCSDLAMPGQPFCEQHHQK